MEELLKKQENESLLQYRAKLYKNKVQLQMNHKEIYELYIKETNDTIAESSCRCSAVLYNQSFEEGYEKALTEKGRNDELYELEEKRKEMEKEKIKFQDQKREYRNYLKVDARFEHLKETVVKEIQSLNSTKPLINCFKNEIYGDREATILLSDFHMGLEVKNYWNEFNKKIAIKRIEDLKNQIIQNCKRHSVTTLHIELLGDLVNGYIHVGTRISNEEDVISQTMFCAEVLSEFVNDLIIHIPNIKVYSSTGNHARCMANFKDSMDSENFERLMPWYMKSRVKSQNIEFVDNTYDDNIIVYNVLNETIFAVHGHQDKMISIVNDLSKMMKIFPTEIHCGHYHRNSSITDGDIELIINGSLCSTDEYAKSIRKTNKASQTLIIYNNKGQECKYNIKL